MTKFPKDILQIVYFNLLIYPYPIIEKELCINLPDNKLGTTGLLIQCVVCLELKPS